MSARKNYPDLTNETFGRLKVLYRAPNHRGHVAYQCASSLMSNETGRATRSCGCLRREVAVQKIANGICEREVKHGFVALGRIPKEYKSWMNARRLYSDVSDFPEFRELVGPAPELRSRLKRQEDGTFRWT
jgi:hypothetical protein